MLAKEFAGQPLNKSEHRRALQDRIDRGEGSIEYKHQNISAVLVGLGETWIVGYRPAFNYQRALEDAVLRWLAGHPAWTTRTPSVAAMNSLAENPALWIGPAPTLSNAPEPKELEQAMAVARR